MTDHMKPTEQNGSLADGYLQSISTAVIDPGPASVGIASGKTCPQQATTKEMMLPCLHCLRVISLVAQSREGAQQTASRCCRCLCVRICLNACECATALRVSAQHSFAVLPLFVRVCVRACVSGCGIECACVYYASACVCV